MEVKMRKNRHNYTAKEKVAIIKQHLVEHTTVSELCEKYKLQPTVFYRWLKEFFDNGAAAFEKDTSRKKNTQSEQIKKLEQKIAQKDSVLAELMYEHVQLKKNLGEI
ncbi:MAG: Transposase [Parcubacteria group bacterium ADurb.Bin216]|nr:MAG: Transposase [Parcubacteria group bacterium ADurb.Bin216]